MKKCKGATVSPKFLGIASALAALAIAASSAPSSAAPPRGESPQQRGAQPSDTPRERALRDCNAEVSKYGMSTWQSTQQLVYGECMAIITSRNSHSQ